MLRQTSMIFLSLVFLANTALAQSNAESKSSVRTRLPMDVGALIGAGVISGDTLWLVTGADLRARLIPWLGVSAGYEFNYYGEYSVEETSGPSDDYQIFAHRALAMVRFYPGRKGENGFFLGIGGGAQWLHGLIASREELDCSTSDWPDPGGIPSTSCSREVWSVRPAGERQFRVPSGMLRASIGGEGAVGRVIAGAELTVDLARVDQYHYRLQPSLRLRVAYGF